MHEITSWSEEMRAAYLYRVVAQAEAGTPRQSLFLQLADEAEGQAAIWADKARAAGALVPAFAPDMRARVVAGLVRSHGPRRLRTPRAMDGFPERVKSGMMPRTKTQRFPEGERTWR